MVDAIYAKSVTFKTLTNGELRAQIEVDKNHASAYMDNFFDPGTPMGIALISNAAALKEDNKPKKGKYGDYAKKLKLSSFFRSPRVWAAIGSDKDYLAWIRLQPSCISGEFSEYVNSEGCCVAAHVRRSSESGTAFKADYACVPLTQEEHDLQHNQGEAACLNYHYPYPFSLPSRDKTPYFTSMTAKEWFDKKRIEYVSNWAWQVWKEKIGVGSMSLIAPDAHNHFAATFGVVELLPSV